MRCFRAVVLLAIAAFAALAARGQGGALVRPPFLRVGDSVAVVSPCSTPDESTVAAGCATLRRWGFVPVVAPHALSSWHGFAGTADERAADLRWALGDSTIRAVLCTRGGDGGVQVLQRMPLAELGRHPKWLIGFSDVTALHSGMVQAGVMSIHGSMCHAISAQGGTDSVSVMLRRLLMGHLPVCSVPRHELDQPGTAEGVLVGGNFSVLCGLAGSAYDCLQREDDLILFIEDTDESMTKVDRMLHHLEIRGVLPRLKGILVGHFTKYKKPENDFADMYAMLHEYLQHYRIPVSYGFPVGHARPNLPLVEGARVRLSVGDSGTRLEYLP